MTWVSVSGPPEGEPVVFLHGGMLNRVMWKPVVAYLKDRYRCVTFDLPGHGSRMGEEFTMGKSLDATLEVIAAHAGGRATLVGLSLGGYVAQAAAARRPEAVAGLLLSGATIRYTGWAGITTSLYGYAFPLLGRAAVKAFPRQLAKTVGEDLAAEIVAAGLSPRAAGQSLRRLPCHDYAADLAGFPGPVVVANGERDKENVKHVPHLLRHVPQAEVVTIEDAGHACALQQPRAFADAVELVLKH